ncbi:MAG: hypothetical protein NQ127_02795 [Candidatus Cardinium sp.]|nr:hypothetical protein [Candidatus Cardinium sp.]
MIPTLNQIQPHRKIKRGVHSRKLLPIISVSFFLFVVHSGCRPTNQKPLRLGNLLATAPFPALSPAPDPALKLPGGSGSSPSASPSAAFSPIPAPRLPKSVSNGGNQAQGGAPLPSIPPNLGSAECKLDNGNQIKSNDVASKQADTVKISEDGTPLPPPRPAAPPTAPPTAQEVPKGDQDNQSQLPILPSLALKLPERTSKLSKSVLTREQTQSVWALNLKTQDKSKHSPKKKKKGDPEENPQQGLFKRLRESIKSMICPPKSEKTDSLKEEAVQSGTISGNSAPLPPRSAPSSIDSVQEAFKSGQYDQSQLPNGGCSRDQARDDNVSNKTGAENVPFSKAGVAVIESEPFNNNVPLPPPPPPAFASTATSSQGIPSQKGPGTKQLNQRADLLAQIHQGVNLKKVKQGTEDGSRNNGMNSEPSGHVGALTNGLETKNNVPPPPPPPPAFASTATSSQGIPSQKGPGTKQLNQRADLLAQIHQGVKLKKPKEAKQVKNLASSHYIAEALKKRMEQCLGSQSEEEDNKDDDESNEWDDEG